METGVMESAFMEFDGWTVDRVSGEISRGDRAARLPQQPLRILIELFDHAGAVVTRDQLVKVLWPAGIVDFDNGLNVAMRKLRVALEDVGDAPRYIETLPRVGYRFVGKPGAAATGAAPEIRPEVRRRSPARIALALTLVALGAGVGVSWWLWSGRDTSRHVPSERAQELYLDGLQLRSRRDIDATELSIAKFASSLQEDPNYPEAWAAYGSALTIAVIRQKMTPAEGIPKARAAAMRAIELAPGEAFGYVLQAQILMDHDKDFAGAKRELDRAMQLDDHESLVWHHLAMWYGQVGQVEEAFAAIRRARELEPTRPIYTANYSLLLYETRRYEEAIDMAKQVVERNAQFDQARSVLARALLATGDLAGALEQAQANGDSGPNQGDRGMVYAKLGRRDDALRELERLDERARRGFAVAYEQAQIYATLGEIAEGCTALTRAVTDHSLLVNWMRLEPRLDPLRGSQCYADAEGKLYGP
jgi:DNA-binding winged helix-turn-helix (wHTH) protein/tetratricopeptide (TPR) repeat protein